MNKTKVLLVKYHDTNIRPIPDDAERTLQVFPSLGIMYLASTLREAGFPVEILDVNAEFLNEDEFFVRVRDSKARVVGFTSMTAGWPSTVRGTEIAREALPEAFIVVGGPQLSIYPELCVSFPSIDAGVYGDGEETMLEIAQAIEGGSSLENIPGLVLKVDGGVKKNPERTWYRDIDRYPFPAVDLLNWKLYHALTVASPFYSMITTRGCPYKCKFCSQVYAGNTIRYRSPENVVDEIEIYVRKYGAREIVFFDETFTLKKSRIMRICELIKERKIKVRFDMRTRVDALDEEMIVALREAGAKRVHFGIESGSQTILDRMRKDITIEQIRTAVRLCKKHGYQTRGYFMIGYLGESPETFWETVNLARDLDLDWASFSITTPLPHTALFEEAL
ncbi:MAG TPA: radical SAM protein, partial [Candidatus Nitrosotenuis sp.]|nr:radical SAM protein [Candidatus Nitrosotenuis sp.]